MITLLRKIRQRLLKENHFPKYLLYAAGEILLVMIGILLALQVNNWNEKRLNQQKEITTIHALQNELIINQEYHYTLLEGLEENVKKNGFKLIELTKPKPETISETKFLKMVFLTSRIPPYTPKMATFQKIINTEDLSLIQNDSMKTLLIEYQALLNWVQGDFEGLRMSGQMQEEYEKKHLVRLNMVLGSENKWLHLFKDMPKSEFHIQPKNILADPVFENLMVETIISYNYVNRSTDKLLQHIDLMQQFIVRNY